MMTKDGITNLTTRPGLEIDPELRLLPNWIVTTLICLGMVSTILDALIDVPAKSVVHNLVSKNLQRVVLGWLNRVDDPSM